ncbi:cytochrome c biogenesis protein CcsA [bacterium]|nr:cytochrome c biogenesis protein CcsA [bacterium]
MARLLKILKIPFSMPAMAVMILVMAVSFASATFIEKSHGTETARALVYNAGWMTAIWILLAANLFVNIFRFRLWRRGKRLVLLFHSAFLVILTGAAITRYFGVEGDLHFREGESAGSIVSYRSHLNIRILKDGLEQEKSKALWLSDIGWNRFSTTVRTGDAVIRLVMKDYIPQARPGLIEDSEGYPVLILSVSNDRQGPPLMIPAGETRRFHGWRFSFESDSERIPLSLPLGKRSNPNVFLLADRRYPAANSGELQSAAPDSGKIIRFYLIEGAVFFTSVSDVRRISMMSRESELIREGTVNPLTARTLFSAPGVQFALRDFMPAARIIVERIDPGEAGYGEAQRALLVQAECLGRKKETALFWGEGEENQTRIVRFGDLEAHLSFGPRTIALPFSLTLEDFRVERYPGSRMPSSYASDVVLTDPSRNLIRPYPIYMNHILKHRGYRFFQSSYDEDEKGSILSVSHDPGTPVAYAGYILAGLALILGLFSKTGRFRNTGPVILLMLMTGLSGTVFGAGSPDSAVRLDRRHMGKLDRILVQDNKGRMKPFQSMAEETMRLLGRPDRAWGIDGTRILYSLFLFPDPARDWKLIRVEPDIAGIPGLAGGFASLSDFYDRGGNYRLASALQNARSGSGGIRKAQRDAVLKTDGRVRACLSLLEGRDFLIFPIPGDSAHAWTNPASAFRLLPAQEAAFAENLMKNLRDGVSSGIRSGDWQAADRALAELSGFQEEQGKDVLPGRTRIRAEILYNDLDIFEWLWIFNLLLGAMLLLPALFESKIPRWIPKYLNRGFFILFLASFGLHTLGLVLRWIASGHAPWSNKYESLIYIAWTMTMAGILLHQRQKPVQAASLCMSGLVLYAAHLDWVNPALTLLQPVLKSIWLIIHVSVITASYGFFGLSAALGLIVLSSFLFCNRKNTGRLRESAALWTRINEKSLLAGLVLVTVGNFFGAVWANESWGRYWGWDPKETWTLIIILSYTLVLHLRLIRGMNSLLVLNAGSVLAFGTVLMTYLGVNLYLSGMHSYAGGEAAGLPALVPVLAAGVLAMIILGWMRGRKVLKKSG